MSNRKIIRVPPREALPPVGAPVGARLSISRWIAGFLFIELVWTFVGGFATFLITEATRDYPWSSSLVTMYLLHHVNFLILLGAIVLFVTRGLRIPMIRFITNAPKFRWKLFMSSAGIWLIGVSIATVVTAIVEPQAILPNPTDKLWRRLMVMVLVLVFTPIQCIAEELFFRTMLWRMLEHRMKRGWLISVISGLVFTFAHLTNVEVRTSNQVPLVLLYYFMTGMLFMEMTRAHGGTEASFGAHVANNLFLVLAVNYPDSSLPSDPWLLQQDPSIVLDLTVMTVCSLAIIRRAGKTAYR